MVTINMIFIWPGWKAIASLSTLFASACALFISLGGFSKFFRRRLNEDEEYLVNLIREYGFIRHDYNMGLRHPKQLSLPSLIEDVEAIDHESWYVNIDKRFTQAFISLVSNNDLSKIEFPSDKKINKIDYILSSNNNYLLKNEWRIISFFKHH